MMSNPTDRHKWVANDIQILIFELALIVVLALFEENQTVILRFLSICASHEHQRTIAWMPSTAILPLEAGQPQELYSCSVYLYQYLSIYFLWQ